MDKITKKRAWALAHSVERFSLAAAAVAGIIGALAKIWELTNSWFGEAHRGTALATVTEITVAIHLLMIAVFVVWRTQIPPMHAPVHHKNEHELFPRALDATRQFTRFWHFTWVAWLGMYGVIVLFKWKILSGVDDGMFDIAKDFFGLLASSQLFLCYLVMAKPTLAPDHESWYWEVSLILLSCVLIVGVQWIVTIHAANPHLAQEYFERFEGLLSGVGLALLIGRFAGRLIASPTLIIVILYAYAVLQFSLPDLSGNQLGQQLNFFIIIGFALVFKGVLFFEVRRVIKEGILTYYMLEYRKLYDRDQKHRSRLLNDMLRRSPKKKPPNGPTRKDTPEDPGPI